MLNSWRRRPIATRPGRGRMTKCRPCCWRPGSVTVSAVRCGRATATACDCGQRDGEPRDARTPHRLGSGLQISIFAVARSNTWKTTPPRKLKSVSLTPYSAETRMLFRSLWLEAVSQSEPGLALEAAPRSDRKVPSRNNGDRNNFPVSARTGGKPRHSPTRTVESAATLRGEPPLRHHAGEQRGGGDSGSYFGRRCHSHRWRLPATLTRPVRRRTAPSPCRQR